MSRKNPPVEHEVTIDDSIAFQELRSQLYAADYRPARAQAKRELRAIAVDGKALKGSARLDVKRRHLLSAATQGTMVTLAQAEVGAKTNDSKHCRTGEIDAVANPMYTQIVN
jgi:hypothetical protein